MLTRMQCIINMTIEHEDATDAPAVNENERNVTSLALTSLLIDAMSTLRQVQRLCQKRGGRGLGQGARTIKTGKT